MHCRGAPSNVNSESFGAQLDSEPKHRPVVDGGSVVGELERGKGFDEHRSQSGEGQREKLTDRPLRRDLSDLGQDRLMSSFDPWGVLAAVKVCGYDDRTPVGRE